MPTDSLLTPSPLPDVAGQRDSTIKLLLLVFVAGVLVTLLFPRVSGINGTQHFIWFYRGSMRGGSTCPCSWRPCRSLRRSDGSGG